MSSTTETPGIGHIIGNSRIQEKNNRVTLPESFPAFGLFRCDGSREIAFWGYDLSDRRFVFSNSQQEIREDDSIEYIKPTTVSSNRVLPIPKQFFPDYSGRPLPSPVNEENRLDYGMKIFFSITTIISKKLGTFRCTILRRTEVHLSALA